MRGVQHRMLPLTVMDYQGLATWKGMTWVGRRLPENALSKTQWMCKRKHIWEARYADIYMERTCPVCNNHKVKTDEDYVLLAEKFNIKLLGPVPKHSRIMTLWKDMQGRIFLTSFRNLQWALQNNWSASGLTVSEEHIPRLKEMILAGKTQRIHGLDGKMTFKDNTFLARRKGKVKVKALKPRKRNTGRPVGRPRKDKGAQYTVDGNGIVTLQTT